MMGNGTAMAAAAVATPTRPAPCLGFGWCFGVAFPFHESSVVALLLLSSIGFGFLLFIRRVHMLLCFALCVFVFLARRQSNNSNIKLCMIQNCVRPPSLLAATAATPPLLHRPNTHTKHKAVYQPRIRHCAAAAAAAATTAASPKLKTAHQGRYPPHGSSHRPPRCHRRCPAG